MMKADNKKLKVFKNTVVMHWMTIAGVTLIAAGTFLTRLGDWKIIPGVIVAAVGTYFTILGTSKRTKTLFREETARTEILFKQQMSSISAKIEQLKKDSSPECLSEVQQIEDEFNKWAIDFHASKAELKMAIDKTDLSVKEKIITLNQQYRKIYVSFFDTLRQYIEAYNDKAKTKLLYVIKEFPDDLFSKEAETYKAKVKFHDNIVWKLALRVMQPIDSTDIPMLTLSIDDNYEDRTWVMPEFTIVFRSLDSKPDMYIVKQNDKLIVPSLKQQYDLGSYLESFKEILKTLIQYQLIKAEREPI